MQDRLERTLDLPQKLQCSPKKQLLGVSEERGTRDNSSIKHKQYNLPTNRLSSIESTMGTTRFNPDQSLMKAMDTGYGTFHISMMTDGSVKKPFSPMNNKSAKKKDLVVPNPNDRVVH